MNYTDNYSMKKPESTDVIDIDDINYNTDIIDAELADIRVGYNGKTYSSAGNAVRSQVENLHEKIDVIKDAAEIGFPEITAACFKLVSEETVTRNGVTWTRDGNGYIFSGTATSSGSYANIISKNRYIREWGFIADYEYMIDYSSDNEAVYLQLFFYDVNDIQIGSTVAIRQKTIIKIPQGTKTLILRTRLTDATISSGYISDIRVYALFDRLKAVDTAETNEDDVTDMYDAIRAMLISRGVCKFGEGVFYTSGSIPIPANSLVEGCGEKTIIKLLDSVSSGYVFNFSKYVTIENLKIVGSFSSIHTSFTNEIGSRDALHFTAHYDGTGGSSEQSEQCFINNVYIYGFTGSGLLCHNTSINYNKGIYVSQTNISECHTGINIDYYSEFNKFVNVCMAWCYTAAFNGGGNNNFTNCTFHATAIGFEIAGGDEHPNNAHGVVTGCTFCHIGSNQGIAIKLRDIGGGYVFSSCQVHYNSIDIADCYGVVFNSFQFGHGTTGAGAVINISGGRTILFNGCIFANDNAYPPEITIENNTRVKFVSCFGAVSGNEIQPD